MNQLENRVAIVTGAASGIGLAAAQALAAQGAHVVLADIDRVAGEEAAQAIHGAYFLYADLTKADDCTRLVEQTLTHSGRVDILVNNAGIQYVAPIETFPEERWRMIMDMMLTAPFLLTKAVLPGMYQQQWGRIINIGSVHSLRASAYKSAYVAAKHGLLGLTRVTAIEGAPHGVTCNCVCPSYVRTALVEKQIADQAKVHGIPEAEVVEKIMVVESPIHRLLEPSEVADSIVYLCSQSAAGVTGSAFTIDCGWTSH